MTISGDVGIIRLTRYLRRLIGFSLLVGLLPIAVLGFFSYSKSSWDIQEKVNEANSQLLQQTQMTVEQTLRMIQHSAIRFANSPLVNTSIDRKLTPEDFRLIDDIQTELAALSVMEMETFNSYLINIDNDWSISREGLSTAADAISTEEIESYAGLPENAYWVSGATAEESGTSGQVSLVIKVPLNFSKPKGLLVIRTSSQDINKLSLKSKRPGSILLLNEHNRVVAGDDEALIGKDYSEWAPMMEIESKETESGYVESRMGGDLSGISFIKSGYNGWTYLSIVSIKDITRESRVIGWVTLAMSLSVMLVTVAIALAGSIRMYRPVRSLYDLSASVSDALEPVQRNAEEFGIIGERIKRLGTLQSRMSEQLGKQVEQLNEFFVMKLLRGELGPGEIGEGLKRFGHVLDWKQVCVLALQIDTLEHTAYDEKDRDLMLFAMKNIAGDLTAPEERLSTILTGQTLMVVLGGNLEQESAFKDHIYQRAEALQHAIKHYLKLKVSIGISRTHPCLEDLPTAYRESLEALKYRVKLGFESILFIGDIELGAGRHAYPEQLEQRLLDALKQTDAEQAHLLLNEWIQEVFESESRLDEYQLSLVRLLIQLMRVVQESGESLGMMDLESKSIISKLFELSTKEEIRQWFTDSVIDPIIKLLDEKRTAKHRSIADDVLRMIREEYDTDLTMESCADRLQYHPSYIWRVLRKEVGLNFSDYLAQHRLKVAKGWLQETDMTITEIAEKLRYNNAQNFIRYFKKMEGVSPGKYRDHIRNEEASRA
ncbi:helix-turn-helix domain-containing protein [Paenibacillus sp. HB172176]|uniref:helix-turn-helix domain-containing protein n=1 Tax=Paenibacillus sp. HB172176 TaxID=2493690 RepID=UPI00143A1CF7|nr:helix-turn-helix domain-containing protein [Paenibacillus sp. HB172176]